MKKKTKHVWVTNYYTKNFVYKELNKIYMGHNNYSHLKIPFISKNYNKKKYNFIIYFIHTHIALYYQKLSNYRKKKYFNNNRFFPKIIDDKNNYDLIVCERIKKELYNLSKQDINFNVKNQIFMLDKTLKEKGFYLDDMHLKNFMLDDNNQLKVIDGELYTPLEHWILRLFIETFDSQVSNILQI